MFFPTCYWAVLIWPHVLPFTTHPTYFFYSIGGATGESLDMVYFGVFCFRATLNIDINCLNKFCEKMKIILLNKDNVLKHCIVHEDSRWTIVFQTTLEKVVFQRGVRG